MLMPKKVKHRKIHRGRLKGSAQRGSSISFGEIAIKALERGKLNSRQIEAARISITRKVKRGGKLWIRVFPDQPFTKKPAETRQGKGKGNPEGFEAHVLPGRILFELAGVNNEIGIAALKAAASKLPIKTKVITLED
ncbi:MAG: 50S ribosomal protein L16 [Spirochaetes bacterium]|nr:50S ribosomal protein L16 [Spirochaetota bacterium]MBN2769129.1 50S ribosomal protein L16 [Spirochaetota bacterium]HRX15365.1 50S ribosomal protein L16 [Spirochaetota bacterium]